MGDGHASLPPTVPERLDRSLREYWLERAAQHTCDSYAGVQLMKFPEDLRVYEHLLWDGHVNAVIELGAAFGASALWFRDRLRTMETYGRIGRWQVISVDVDVSQAQPHLEGEEGITLMPGDLNDPALPEAVADELYVDSNCLVVEDSAHIYSTTRAALDGFARFVGPGGFFVVEDGCVDIEEMRLLPDWPRGALPAIDDWLASPQGQEFSVRRELEIYGLSCHPRGFLQRSTTAAPASPGRRRRRRRLLGRRRVAPAGAAKRRPRP